MYKWNPNDDLYFKKVLNYRVQLKKLNEAINEPDPYLVLTF